MTPIVIVLNVVFSIAVLAAVVGLLVRNIATEHRALSALATRHPSPEATQTVTGKAPRREATRALPATAATASLA